MEKNNGWIKNEFGEIIDKDNIDSYISQLAKKDASDLAQKIREQSIALADAKEGWEDYFAELKNNGQGYIVDLIKNTDDLSKLTGEDLLTNKPVNPLSITTKQSKHRHYLPNWDP